MKYFDTFMEIAYKCGRFGQIKLLPQALKSCLKCNKSPNLATLVTTMMTTDDLYVWDNNQLSQIQK